MSVGKKSGKKKVEPYRRRLQPLSQGEDLRFGGLGSLICFLNLQQGFVLWGWTKVRLQPSFFDANDKKK
jgi:hypothetical protein